MDDKRWEDVEKRLAALEARLADTSSPLARDEFWALDELRRRAQGRSQVLFTGAVDLPTGESYLWQETVDAGELLSADLSAAAPALSALAHPVRLSLLGKVLHGRRTVAELAEGLGTTGQLYHHLRQLVAAGWLEASARGTYAVPGARVVPLLTLLATAGLR
ncbi:ArsR/SmtB family transcription factor [Kineococcus xinjiangensis]|uniref:ArsR/SmtB family transcription factor n=1 Tax=Kineococcus xinjiangensis TaxID=512762 RepID=UPI001B804722|nr:winged helix-turn-helix domain-containing protein [Kineococcus xinjiangensis]